MSAAIELRNEAREALRKAMTARDEAHELEQGGKPDEAVAKRKEFQGHWDEYREKDKRAETAAVEEEALKAATEKYDWKPTDIRNPNDAKLNLLPADKAKEGVQLDDGKVVPFASEKSEGWIKGYPASVQHPEIIRRLTPDLRMAAALENEAFCKWFRYGLRALSADERKALMRLRDGQKALQEDTDAEGGFLVPTDQRRDVILARGALGGVTRPISTVLTTTRDAGTMPASTDAVTWAAVAEEAAPGESVPTISEVAFTIKKFMRIGKVSAELLEDSAVDIPTLLTGMFVRSLGRYEDQQAIEGDNATEPLGLRTTGAGQGDISDITDLLTLAAPTAIEIVSAFYELPAQWRANATWHTTSSFLARIATIGAAAAGIHFMELIGSEPTPRLLGRPIVMFDGTGWDDAATIGANEEVGAFGDFSMYYFVDRVGMSMRRLDELYAGNDQVGFAARVRYDSLFAENDAFRILKGATS